MKVRQCDVCEHREEENPQEEGNLPVGWALLTSYSPTSVKSYDLCPSCRLRALQAPPQPKRVG